MSWLTAAAVLAALLMAAGAVALVRRSVLVPWWLIAGSGTAAMLVTGIGAALLDVLGIGIAVSLAAAAFPVVIPLAAATTAGGGRRRAPVIAAAVWAAVVVPAALLIPPFVVRSCPPQVCVIEDFGGALAFVVASGAFLIVPSAATLGRNALRSGSGSVPVDVGATFGIWVGFVVWLTALEGAVDEFSPLIALAAALAPVAGAIGWVLVDRVRAVPSTYRRGARLGLVAGMAAVMPCVVAVSTPWAVVIGFLGGAVGALVHDARGMAQTAPGTRAAVAAMTVGAIGLVAPGIVGSTLGFIFAARADVLGLQLAAVVGASILGVAASIPASRQLRGPISPRSRTRPR